MTLTEDDLKQVRAEIVAAFGKLAEMADYYTSGFGDLTSSAAHLLKDAVEMATRKLVPAEPEPVNPFAPKRTPQEWADAIRAVALEAENDGYAVWTDTVPPLPSDHLTYWKVGTVDSEPDADPIAWETGQ